MRGWPDAIWFQSCSFVCLKNFKQRLTEPLMRKLIKKPSERGKQITCTTQSPLSSSFPPPPPRVRNDKAKWVIRSKQSAQWACLYLVALMPFILLHCSTKMLPRQQEGLLHVMVALVKPLIVCIWVELELVIGEAHIVWFPSLSLESLFIPGKGGSFLPSRHVCDYLLKVSSGGLCQGVLFRAGPAAGSFPSLLKSGIFWARIDSLPPGL